MGKLQTTVLLSSTSISEETKRLEKIAVSEIPMRKFHKYIEETMKNRREELTAKIKNLAEVKIQRVILHGNAIFALLFVMVILFTNPSARAGYDTRSIFKRSLTGLNSEFSFS